MNKYLIDTNVFLYLVNTKSEFHPWALNAIGALKSAGDELYITTQIIQEFWCKATKTGPKGLGWTLERTSAALLLYTSGLFEVLPDPSTVLWDWYQLCLKERIVAETCYDARIVSVMKFYGIPKIVTLNQKDFVKFSDIEVIDPRSL